MPSMTYQLAELARDAAWTLFCSHALLSSRDAIQPLFYTTIQ